MQTKSYIKTFNRYIDELLDDIVENHLVLEMYSTCNDQEARQRIFGLYGMWVNNQIDTYYDLITIREKLMSP